MIYHVISCYCFIDKQTFVCYYFYGGGRGWKIMFVMKFCQKPNICNRWRLQVENFWQWLAIQVIYVFFDKWQIKCRFLRINKGKSYGLYFRSKETFFGLISIRLSFGTISQKTTRKNKTAKKKQLLLRYSPLKTDLFRIQSNICNVGHLFSQKSSIADVPQGSKYTTDTEATPNLLKAVAIQNQPDV